MKIKEYYAKKSDYYKKLSPKKGVYQTAEERNTRNKMGSGLIGGINATKVTAARSLLARDPSSRTKEDILLEFSNAARAFIPYLEQQQEQYSRQAAQKRIREEELKFEDEDYLQKYFTEMRQQIEKDFRNIETYFPPNLTRKYGRMHSHLFTQRTEHSNLNDSDEELLATAISISRLNKKDSADVGKLKQLLNPKNPIKKSQKKLS